MHPRTGVFCLLLVAVYHVTPIRGRSQIDRDILTRLEALEKQVSTQQHQLDVQNDLITDQQVEISGHKTTIQELQKTTVEQHAEIVQQKTQLRDQQRTTVEQHAEIVEQKTQLRNQQRRLLQLEESLQTRKQQTPGSDQNTFNATSSKPVQTDQDIKEFDGHIENKQTNLNARFVLESGGSVAFHAVNSHAENAHIGINQKIIFDKVLLNLGNGFHSLHGLFTAPAGGLYIFSTSIMSWISDHSEISVKLLKNGVALANAYGHGDSNRHDQGSVTVVAQLAVGDEVYVSLAAPADDWYYGRYFTSFTGCLLWPL